MMGTQRLLRLVFLFLAVFDFVLGTLFVFFGGHLLHALGLADYAQPRFFMACVGLFLYQYVYIQFMVFKDPYKYATCLNMSLLIRLSFPLVYVSAILLWGAPRTLLHTIFAIAALGDLATSVLILVSMRKLRIAFLRGDEHVPSTEKGPSVLRYILLVLGISEFLISWNWMLIPKFWLHFFDVAYVVDPFWTRATGAFLVNIAYIQFLGYLDVHKYRTAAITSGLFRALWPLLYWYWTAFGNGNIPFKISIMFFSFFDTAMCITIFSLLKRARKQQLELAATRS